MPDQTVRWVQPDSLHITLKFLGDVPTTAIPEIETRLAHIAQKFTPFPITIEGTGCFPNLKAPKVVWLGIPDSQDHLHALRDSVESYIAPLGYPTEERPFNPHLTLGRIKRGVTNSKLEKVGLGVKNSNITAITAWTCYSISLMESDLKPSGAEYTCLHNFGLTQ